MSRNSRKKPASRFKKGFTIYIVVLLLLMAAVLYVLWRFLANYQKGVDEAAAAAAEKEAAELYARDVHEAPQRAFEDFLATTDAEYWVDKWYESNPQSLDDRQKMTEALEGYFFGEDFACYKAESFTQEAPVYVLKSGETKLATVSMTGSELNWSVADVTLLLSGGESASVEVPDGCTVYCNGQVLDDSYRSQEHSYFDSDDFRDQLKNPVEWATYTIEGQFFAPELTAEAPADRTLYTTEDGIMGYVLSADAAESYQKQGEEFARALLHYYYMGGSNTYGNMAAVRALVVPNSPAYTLITDSANGVSWDSTYPNATYEATAQQVIIWADNCMSMDVTYHAEGTTSGYTNVSDGTYRLYFVDNGNGFGICGLSYV